MHFDSYKSKNIFVKVLSWLSLLWFISVFSVKIFKKTTRY